MGAADAFAQRLGLPIRDLELLEQALVHSSYLHEHRDAARGHNERLEFLGDAVVNLAMSEALYNRHPDDDEGILSARRASIVSTPGLARLAARLELGDHLLLGEGEAQRGGRRRPSLLASAFEALSGALYLDLGWDATRAWLVALAAPEIAADTAVTSLKSPKSRLQEHTQRTTGDRPVYRVLDASGPDHEKIFQIEVIVEGRVLGFGEGPSRRIAETAAAAEALETLRREREAGRRPAAEPEVEAELVDVIVTAIQDDSEGMADTVTAARASRRAGRRLETAEAPASGIDAATIDVADIDSARSVAAAADPSSEPTAEA